MRLFFKNWIKNNKIIVIISLLLIAYLLFSSTLKQYFKENQYKKCFNYSDSSLKNVFLNGYYTSTVLPQETSNLNLSFYGTWDSNMGDKNTAYFKSEFFDVTENLNIWVGGYPIYAICRINYMNESGKIEPVNIQSAIGEKFEAISINPKYQKFQLEIIDSTTNIGSWVAFSEPWKGNSNELKTFEMYLNILNFFLILIIICCLSLFLIIIFKKERLYINYKIIIIALFFSILFNLLFNLISPLNLYLKGGVMGHDPYHYLNSGISLLSGQIPYKDFWDNKGPLVPFINALIWLLGVKSIHGIFIYGILNYTIVYFILLKIFIRKHPLSTSLYFLSITILIIGGICDSWNQLSSNMLEEILLPFELYSIFIFFKTENDIPTKKTMFLQGILFIIIFCIRQNAIIVPLAVFFGYIIKLCFYYFNNRIFDIKSIVKNFTILFCNYILGIFSVFILFFLYFWYHNSLLDWYNLSWVYNFSYIKEENSTGSLFVFLHSIKSFKSLFIVVIPFYFLCLYDLIKSKNINNFLFVNILFVCCAFLSFMSGRSYWHYSLMLVPFFIVMFYFTSSKIINNSVLLISVIYLLYFTFPDLTSLFNKNFKNQFVEYKKELQKLNINQQDDIVIIGYSDQFRLSTLLDKVVKYKYLGVLLCFNQNCIEKAYHLTKEHQINYIYEYIHKKMPKFIMIEPRFFEENKDNIFLNKTLRDLIESNNYHNKGLFKPDNLLIFSK